MAVWTVKGGSRGEREDLLLERGLIGGSWGPLASLEDVGGVGELAERFAGAYPDMAAKSRSNYVGQLWSLRQRMQDGELVVMPLKTTGTIAIGRISGPYAYREDLGEVLQHVRPVTWQRTDVARDAFDQDLLYSFGAFLTFAQVRRERAEARILATIGAPTPPPAEPAGAPGGDEGEQGGDADAASDPDIVYLATEQVRQRVSQRFAGHDLATLVAEVLTAQGFTGVSISPPGADRGVDILAGGGPLGMDAPRLAVQVKTGQAGVEEFRQLRGTMSDFSADQGLLVAWGGFRGKVRAEARTSHFTVRLWDYENLLDQVLVHHDHLSAEVRATLSLTRLWAAPPTSQT